MCPGRIHIYFAEVVSQILSLVTISVNPFVSSPMAFSVPHGRFVAADIP